MHRKSAIKQKNMNIYLYTVLLTHSRILLTSRTHSLTHSERGHTRVFKPYFWLSSITGRFALINISISAFFLVNLFLLSKTCPAVLKSHSLSTLVQDAERKTRAACARAGKRSLLAFQKASGCPWLFIWRVLFMFWIISYHWRPEMPISNVLLKCLW